MRTAGWIIAAGVAVATNLAALVPVYRNRTGDVRVVAIVVCSSQLVGGYGERDRLRLAIRTVSSDTTPGLRDDELGAFGFSPDELARIGDTAVSAQRLPLARPAWVRIEQAQDTTFSWRVADVGPTRGSVDNGAGVIVRGRVGLGYESSVAGKLRLRPQLYSTEPTTLYLGAGSADALRALRQQGERCAADSVVLGNGPDGSVWVQPGR